MSPPARVTIFGPGLIGASLLMALRRQWPSTSLRVWARSRERVEQAVARGLADSGDTDPAEAARGAQLIVLCTPVETMPGLVRSLLPGLSPDTVVTDVGSVKARVEQELSPLLDGRARWIGSHPMAGKEKTGMDAAEATLFHGAVAIITPSPATHSNARTTVSFLWESVGARLIELDPLLHDRLVGQISHLPHLIAALLVLCVEKPALPLAGSGFRDATRIAAGPADMWTEILLSNRGAMLECLDRFDSQLHQARHLLEQADSAGLHKLLTSACQTKSASPQ